MARTEEAGSNSEHTRARVLAAIGASDVAIINPDQLERYLLVAKVDDDSLPHRCAAFHRSKRAARNAIKQVPPGWWPDCLIDLDAPASVAVRDAAAGTGSLGNPYPFDADHVIFA